MMKRKAVKKLVKKWITEAIEEYEKTRGNPCNVGRSGPANTGGTVNVKGCSYKTFMNRKPHHLNGMKGVVGLSRWIEKVEQVFEISKCAEEDKVMFATSTLRETILRLTIIVSMNLVLMCPELVPTEKKKVERFIRGFPERIKGNITSLKPTTLHEAINMAHEPVEQAVQGKAARVSKRNKKKWENHQRNTNNNNLKNRNRNNNNQHQQQNRRHETSRAYVAAPAENRGQKCLRVGYEEKDCKARPSVCYEKIVRIPLSNGEILEIQGERPEKDPKLLSCIKAAEKKLDDIRIVRDFPEVFPDV
nr:hypothetical protein [Tanacetum cinerariifolium]